MTSQVSSVAVDQPTVGRSRSRIIKDSGQYLSATLLAQGVGIVRSLMMPVLLMPTQLGIWNLMIVVISYGEKAQLGLLDGMNKALPLMRGEGRHDRTDAMKDSVFWTTLVLAGLAGLTTWVLAWFVPPAFASALRIVSVVVFLQLPFAYIFSLLRADNRFGLLSAGAASLSILSSILILVVAFRSSDHLQGALVGLAGAYLPVVLYLFAAGRYRFAPRIDGASLREALVLGVPVKMLGVIDAVFLSVDRWVIAANLGGQTLGFYALAVMVSSLLCLVPGSVASVVYTRMLERFAVGRDPRAVRTLLVAPLRALAALILVLSACAMIVVPVVITVFIPNYAPSIPLVRTLVVGGSFLSIGLVSATYLTAINRQVLMMKIQVAATIVSLVGNTLAVRAGYGVQGVAIVTSLAYACVGLGFTIRAFQLACRGRAEVVRLVAYLIVPVVVMLAATIVAHLLFPAGGGTAHEIVTGLERLAVVGGCVLVGLWLVNRDGELLAIVRTELQSSTWLRGRF